MLETEIIMKRLQPFRSTRTIRNSRVDGFRLPIAVIAVAVMASATPAWAADGNVDRARIESPQRIGVFTGEYVEGVPVYRLPSITVAAERQLQPQHDRRSASARQPHAAPVARRRA